MHANIGLGNYLVKWHDEKNRQTKTFNVLDPQDGGILNSTTFCKAGNVDVFQWINIQYADAKRIVEFGLYSGRVHHLRLTEIMTSQRP